ncbi:MAG: hypothetical protein U0935_07200 [Pirellulales bacterium]
MLEFLADWNRCSCAIVRGEGPTATDLVLEGYRFGEDVDNDQQLAVPARKSLQFFHCNPFTCCFTQHYPHGSLEFLRKKQPTYRGSEAEERFLELVKWRATFPLSVGSSDQKMAILVSFEDTRPEWVSRANLALAWLAGQLQTVVALTGQAATEQRQELLTTAAHLVVLNYLETESLRWSALIRILCSGRSLGWQRVWIMGRHDDSLHCVLCAGGTTIDEWGRSASFASAGMSSLTEEFAHDLVEQPLTRDGLYRVCVEQQVLQVDRAVFAAKRDGQGEGAEFSVPAEMDFDASGRWKNALAKLPGYISPEHEDDERLYCCEIDVAGKEYWILLSWSETRTRGRRPAVIETGAVLAVASELWNAQSNRESLLDTSSPVTDEMSTEGVTASGLAEQLEGLVRHLGGDVPTRLEWELVKARTARLCFQGSAAHREAFGNAIKERTEGTTAR